MQSDTSSSTPSYPLADLCVLADLPPRTVRYYVQMGLVDRPQGETRAARYGATHLEQLLLIKKWTAAGLSLERIRELLHGEQAPVPPRARAVGSVEVRSHLMVADGVDLVIEPGRAGLSSSLQTGSMDDLEIPAFLRSQADDFALPAFLRKRDQIIDHYDPRYWARSEHYQGLTPLGASEWLRITPASQWPTTYVGLRQMGLGVGLVDWLELAMAAQAGTVHDESKVVETFLHLMSRRETYESLAKSEGLLGALQSTVLRLRELLARSAEEKPASNDLGLFEAMVAGLEGMTTSAWPDRVFELGGALEEVPVS